MKKLHIALVIALSSSLVLTGCFKKNETSNFSKSNLERYVPADVSAVGSFSLEDEAQVKALRDIEKRLGNDGRVSKTLTDGFENQLGESGLDFEQDLLPALGDNYRVLFASQKISEEDAIGYSVVSLEDPDALEASLDRLTEEGDLDNTKLNKFNAYVDSEANFYSSIQGNVLLISSTADGLVSMVEQDEKTSLANDDTYKEVLKEAGSGNLFHVVLFPQNSPDMEEFSGFSIGSIPAVLEYQSFALKAAANGFNFDAYVQADKELAKEQGVSFDNIPRSKPYLFAEVPSEDLMFYFESYGLQQTFEQAESLGDESGALDALDEATTSFLSADLQEELLAFMGKGYVVSAHQNGDSIVPGISFYVDASGDTGAAEAVLAQIDGQLSGLLILLQSALPGAITKGTTTVNGSAISQLVVDLSKIDTAGTGQSALPPVLGDTKISLSYGLVGDRLLITLADAWGGEGYINVAESDLYKELAKELGRVDEGLILLDAQGFASFVESLSELRGSLDLGIDESQINFGEILDGFTGAIAASDTTSTNTHFRGIFKLND